LRKRRDQKAFVMGRRHRLAGDLFAFSATFKFLEPDAIAPRGTAFQRSREQNWGESQKGPGGGFDSCRSKTSHADFLSGLSQISQKVNESPRLQLNSGASFHKGQHKGSSGDQSPRLHLKKMEPKCIGAGNANGSPGGNPPGSTKLLVRPHLFPVQRKKRTCFDKQRRAGFPRKRQHVRQ